MARETQTAISPATRVEIAAPTKRSRQAAWIPRMMVHSVITLLTAVAAVADDVVIYSTGSDGRGRARVTGVITEYTSGELRIRQATGREPTIPADRVIEIETTWTRQHQVANQLLKGAKFEEALQQFVEAGKEESRPWVKRQIVAQQVRCQRALGKLDQACMTFLSLYASEKNTRHFEAIPLSWTVHQPSRGFERRCLDWLQRGRNPVAALMAASWLQSTQHRSQAIASLKALANQPDARIAHLADAQIWRTQTVTAKQEQVQRWESQTVRMPENLRAGPYFILGRTMSRLGQSQEAALQFMRVPILYPEDRQLAAESLHAAGRELERLGQIEEALGLYRENVEDYSELPIAGESKARFEALTKEVKKR